MFDKELKGKVTGVIDTGAIGEILALSAENNSRVAAVWAAIENAASAKAAGGDSGVILDNLLGAVVLNAKAKAVAPINLGVGHILIVEDELGNHLVATNSSGAIVGDDVFVIGSGIKVERAFDRLQLKLMGPKKQ